MKICPNCKKELDDGVKFCTGCGTRLIDAEPTAAHAPAVANDAAAEVKPTATPVRPVEPSATPAPPKEKKPIDFTLFDRWFWVLYVVTGALAFLCVELGSIYTNVSIGFTVFLGVFSLILAVGFAAIAVVRKIATAKESEDERKKHALRDNICLAVAAVMLVFVIVGAIGLFNIAHQLSEMKQSLGSMFS